MNRVGTGIAALDDVLNGGFPQGSTVLLAGRPGTGKTVLAHQMAYHNARPEHKVLYFTTLAEPLVKVMKYQQEFSFFDSDKFQSSVVYQDLGSVLRRNGSARALALIDEMLKKHEPALVFIDSIKTIADVLSSLIECREFLLDLSLRLATWGCTTLLLGEYSEEEIEIRPESAIVDGIVYLSGTEETKRQKRFLRILKMRGTGYSGGENFFRITGDGLEVFPRLNPAVGEQTYRQYEERVSTGIAEMDAMIGGGIPRGTTTLLSGSSGTGKTILALHFASAGLEQGEPAVYVTFEENPAQIMKSAAGLGLDLQPHLDGGRLHFLHVAPTELDLDEHVHIIRKLAAETGARRLVIDSISSFELGMKDKEKYTNYIWAMTDYFKTQGISVYLTHEMHDSASVANITKHGISFLADNLLLLHYLEQGNSTKRFLRVVKMRGCEHSDEVRELMIGRTGLVLGEYPR